jgi:integrase
MVKDLTDLELRRWQPADKREEKTDGKVPGLKVRLSPSGVRSWSLYIRANGLKRRFSLGDGLTLAEARKKAKETKDAVEKGHNPTDERRARRTRQREALGGVGTLGATIDMYYSMGDGRGLKSGAAQKAHLRRVFVNYLNSPALDLKPRDLQLAIDAWPSRSSAQHAVAYGRKLFKWARTRELVGDGFEAIQNPERDEDIEQRRLNVDELQTLLRALTDRPHDGAAMAMLWTAARREEIVGATWREFDLASGIWTIPGPRRKNTRGRRSKNAPPDHIIHLPFRCLRRCRSRARRTSSCSPSRADHCRTGRAGRNASRCDRNSLLRRRRIVLGGRRRRGSATSKSHRTSSRRC